MRYFEYLDASLLRIHIRFMQVVGMLLFLCSPLLLNADNQVEFHMLSARYKRSEYVYLA